MSLYPRIDFIVKTVNYAGLYQNSLPDSNIENIINNLENLTVWIANVDYALKNNDAFTLYGKQALNIYDQYIGSTPVDQRILDVTYFGNPDIVV
jgi:hypothetical protein